ncbi:MAG: universal stress protein [Gemmatimonadota bacterium]|nr:universal stress protein [Gemmatimonadota bacterium]MDH5759563.1 universal stress protein [Gemmatimonadota bacterium]
MLQSLLVPLDGSEFSERTLPLVRGLARATGATVHVAHVHTPHRPDGLLMNPQFHFEGLDMEEYDQRHRSKEARYLKEVVERLTDGEDAVVDSVILDGEVAGEVASYADKVHADMVVIATHAHSGIGRMWLGSVTDALLHITHAPLLVLHPRKGHHVPDAVPSFSHVLVALDGSALSESILGPAVDLAKATGARITLAHVVATESIMGGHFFPVLTGDLTPTVSRARNYLETVARRLRFPRLDVDIHVETHERPSQAISEMAGRLHADVIALSTHGYSGIRRALVGSVADKVLKESEVPLLVMRPLDHP